MEANGIDSYIHLRSVLSLLTYLGNKTSNSEFDELLPKHPQMRG